MTDELLRQLRAWGSAHAAPFAANDDRDGDESPYSHPINKAREFAPMTRKRAALRLAGRDGEGRRRIMGKAAGVKGMAVTPKWSSQPIRCTETRVGGPNPSRFEAAPAVFIPDELRWIDRAISQIHRQAPVRALVVRQEYTGRGTQAAKAAAVARQYGGSLTLRQYRYELSRALDYLHGCAVAA